MAEDYLRRTVAENSSMSGNPCIAPLWGWHCDVIRGIVREYFGEHAS